LAQLAIAWTLAQPGLTHALVGARNPQQAEENATAADVVLADEELTVIAGALARLDISN
jgi:aryl-alcohol dehydrogenase-like predicted oxidoreductase